MSRSEARRARLRRRPRALRLFGWLVFASAAMNVLAILFYASRFRADAVAQGTAKAGWLLAIVIVIVVVSSSLFWWRIAICAGNAARWLYAALMLVGLLQFPQIYDTAKSYGLPYGVMMGASAVLGMMSIILLFRRDSSRWLRSGGHMGEIDPAVFQ